MAPTFTSTTTCWIISRQAGPLPAVRRLRFLPELVDGITTLAGIATFYVCVPRGRRPALTGQSACVILPVNNSPPTKTWYDPVQGRFTVVAASSSGSSSGGHSGQRIHVVSPAAWRLSHPNREARITFLRPSV